MAPPTALPLPDSEILHPVSAVIPTRHRKSPSKQLSNPHFTRRTAPKTGRSHTSENPLRSKTAPLQGRASPTPAGNHPTLRQHQPHSGRKPRRSKAASAPLRRIRRSLGPIPRENYPPPKRVLSPLAGQNPAPRWMLSPTPSELPRLKSASAHTKPVSALRPRQARPLRDGTKFPLNSRIRHYSGQQAPHGQEKQHSSGDPLPLQSKNRRSLRHSDPTFAQNQRSQERTSPTFVGKRCFRR